MANKKFTSNKNDFCIIFNEQSKIVDANDDGLIANKSFQFTSVQDIEEAQSFSTIDIVGIITEVSQNEDIKLKTGG